MLELSSVMVRTPYVPLAACTIHVPIPLPFVFDTLGFSLHLQSRSRYRSGR